MTGNSLGLETKQTHKHFSQNPKNFEYWFCRNKTQPRSAPNHHETHVHDNHKHEIRLYFASNGDATKLPSLDKSIWTWKGESLPYKKFSHSQSLKASKFDENVVNVIPKKEKIKFK